MPAYKIRQFRATEEFYDVEAADEEEAVDLYNQGSYEPYGERTLWDNMEFIEEEQ